MTTTVIELVQGDTNDTRVVQLGGIEAIPGAAALEAHVWRTTSPASTTTLATVLVDAEERTVRIKFGAWIDTAAAGGSWRWEVQVTGTWSDGETGPRTFPTKEGHPLVLRAAGG